ncbi:DUF72 domain-containing protein [bacterium]|nr:DUF72 domain-containing protein [bacterium]
MQYAHTGQGDLFTGPAPERAERALGPVGKRGRIFVGTSGYSFEDWVGPFYPPGIQRNRMLDEYVKHFGVVEINSSYYRIPGANMFARMEEKTPDGFEFIVKLYKGMTHELEDEPEMYRKFTSAVEPLKRAGKFGGYLAQFPWRFRKGNGERRHIAALQERLDGDPLFVEFRHDSWIERETFEFLKEKGVGYCSVDEPGLRGLIPPLAVATTDTAYVRLHGRNTKNWWGRGGDRYDYDYNAEELGEWADKLLKLEGKAKRVYAFFNNCHAGQAARNAEIMVSMLGEELA